MGPYDIVVEISVEDLADVPPILSDSIRIIPGVESTTSLVTFPEA
jgi:DNA-binding Lrp family transcriptional regulator